MQKRLVRLLADFSLAKVVWGYYIEPCIEAIATSDKVWQINKYMSMDAPTGIKDALFDSSSGSISRKKSILIYSRF